MCINPLRMIHNFIFTLQYFARGLLNNITLGCQIKWCLYVDLKEHLNFQFVYISCKAVNWQNYGKVISSIDLQSTSKCCNKILFQTQLLCLLNVHIRIFFFFLIKRLNQNISESISSISVLVKTEIVRPASQYQQSIPLIISITAQNNSNVSHCNYI